MKTVNKGLLWLFMNSSFYSTASLGFVSSGFDTLMLSTWTGLFGVLVALIKLPHDPTFKLNKLPGTLDFYLTLLNGFIFGGSSNALHFWSLKYILPSDSILINSFFCLFSSVVAEIIRDKERPTILSLLSVFVGVIGTGLICNPQALFTLDILQMRSLLGVALATCSGLAFVLMLSNLRRFTKAIPTSWSYFGYMLGTMCFGFISYRPFSTVNLSCALHLKFIAAFAALCHVAAAFCMVNGTTKVTVSGTFVIQTSASVLTFLAQVLLFPDRITHMSTVGTAFIVVSVMIQVIVLRRREHMHGSVAPSIHFSLNNIT